MADPARPHGVHWVGSIRLPNEPTDVPPEVIFRRLSEALPGRLRRLPDGETGYRNTFARWQERVFEPSPWVFNKRQLAKWQDVPDAESREIILNPTGYDEIAIDSYQAFSALQKQGVIEPNVRFQVCIPTPVNSICAHVSPQFQAKVEVKYESLLLDAISNIQAHIPSEKLAIQFDCAVDVAALEGYTGPGEIFKPWFEPSLENVVERVVRVASGVREEVQLGFHLCYGDMNHQHFMQPKDISLLVKFANAISNQLPRPLHFLHMPVPKDRTDDDYFAALGDLRLSKDTDVYLGLVHADDLQGTEARIAAASKVIPRFGVATECGLGRTPASDVSSILEILSAVTDPE